MMSQRDNAPRLLGGGDTASSSLPMTADLCFAGFFFPLFQGKMVWSVLWSSNATDPTESQIAFIVYSRP
jgi:hypothetical protein